MSELLLPTILICTVGLVAGVLGGVIGFGTTILLMPPLVHFYGPLQTVPIIAPFFLAKQVKSVCLRLRIQPPDATAHH